MKLTIEKLESGYLVTQDDGPLGIKRHAFPGYYNAESYLWAIFSAIDRKITDGVARYERDVDSMREAPVDLNEIARSRKNSWPLPTAPLHGDFGRLSVLDHPTDDGA